MQVLEDQRSACGACEQPQHPFGQDGVGPSSTKSSAERHSGMMRPRYGRNGSSSGPWGSSTAREAPEERLRERAQRAGPCSGHRSPAQHRDSHCHGGSFGLSNQTGLAQSRLADDEQRAAAARRRPFRRGGDHGQLPVHIHQDRAEELVRPSAVDDDRGGSVGPDQDRVGLPSAGGHPLDVLRSRLPDGAQDDPSGTGIGCFGGSQTGVIAPLRSCRSG